MSIGSVKSPTNDATPTVSGGAGTEAGDGAVSVTIYKGGAPEGEAAATGKASVKGAAWSYTPSHLPDGTYTAQASQQDEAGNTRATPPTTFTVDTAAPGVSIEPATSPTNDATPTLSGALGTTAGDSSAVSVKIYKGSSASGEVASTGKAAIAGSTWSYTPSHLPDGTYTAKATQQDEAGNTGRASRSTFAVDTAAPAPTIATPTEGALLNVSKTTISGLAGQAAATCDGELKIYFGDLGTPIKTLKLSPSAGNWTPARAPGARQRHLHRDRGTGRRGRQRRNETQSRSRSSTGSPSVTLDTSAFVDRGSAFIHRCDTELQRQRLNSAGRQRHGGREDLQRRTRHPAAPFGKRQAR